VCCVGCGCWDGACCCGGGGADIAPAERRSAMEISLSQSCSAVHINAPGVPILACFAVVVKKMAIRSSWIRVRVACERKARMWERAKETRAPITSLQEVAPVVAAARCLIYGRGSRMRLDLYLLQDTGPVAALRTWLLDRDSRCFVPRFVCLLAASNILLHLFPPISLLLLAGHPDFSFLHQPCFLLY